MKRNPYAFLVAVGISIGAGLGVVMDNIVMGAGIGVIFGATLMLIMTIRTRQKNQNQ